MSYISRKYSSIDMIKFANYCKHAAKHPSKLLKIYALDNPELSEQQRLNNLIKIFNDIPDDI